MSAREAARPRPAGWRIVRWHTSVSQALRSCCRVQWLVLLHGQQGAQHLGIGAGNPAESDLAHHPAFVARPKRPVLLVLFWSGACAGGEASFCLADCGEVRGVACGEVRGRLPKSRHSNQGDQHHAHGKPVPSLNGWHLQNLALRATNPELDAFGIGAGDRSPYSFTRLQSGQRSTPAHLVVKFL